MIRLNCSIMIQPAKIATYNIMLKWMILLIGILMLLAGAGGVVWWLSITSNANSKKKLDDEDE